MVALTPPALTIAAMLLLYPPLKLLGAVSGSFSLTLLPLPVLQKPLLVVVLVIIKD
jgi:hypothetical protein